MAELKPATGPQQNVDNPAETEGIGNSLGVIETLGLVALAEAMDVMVKAAHVKVGKSERIGGGRVMACVRGDVAAVRVAVEAGDAAAARVGTSNSLVIAHPDPQLLKLLGM